MTAIQLNPVIPVITPLGPGDALIWIDYSDQLNSVMLVALDEDHGKLKHFSSDQCRLAHNHTFKS